jgi:hypothetical protein
VNGSPGMDAALDRPWLVAAALAVVAGALKAEDPAPSPSR